MLKEEKSCSLLSLVYAPDTLWTPLRERLAPESGSGVKREETPKEKEKRSRFSLFLQPSFRIAIIAFVRITIDASPSFYLSDADSDIGGRRLRRQLFLSRLLDSFEAISQALPATSTWA